MRSTLMDHRLMMNIECMMTVLHDHKTNDQVLSMKVNWQDISTLAGNYSNNAVCISLYDNLLNFKSLINKSITLFTYLSKNLTYHRARVKLKCHCINVLAPKFLFLSETKFDPLSDIILSGQPLREINHLKLRIRDAEFMLGTKSKKQIRWKRMYIV